MNKKLKKLTYTALLTALAIILPIIMKPLQINIPPFSATPAVHVPVFLGMFLGPAAAIFIGLGSAFGFLFTATPVVAARAAMHAAVGAVGALAIKKKVPLSLVIVITAPVHAILEALIVIPFGFTMYKVLIIVGVGTILHHFFDGTISAVLIKALSKTGAVSFLPNNKLKTNS